MKRWWGFITVALFVLGLAASASAAGYKSEYKMSVVVGPMTSWGQGAQKFADLVKQRTAGRINIKIYYSGQLYAGKQTNEFMLIKQGVADFALGSTINWSTTVKELNLFSLPFLIPDYQALDAIENGPLGGKIFQILAEKGAVALGWGENGFRELTNSKRAVKRPEDLDGLKIRVVGSPIFIDTFRALGANPVSMNWGEALTAFQSGLVDGQENPVTGILIPYKLWTVHKYCTFWHYVIDPLILLAGNETWKTFDKQDQDILRQAAREATAWQKDAARRGLHKSMTAVNELRKHGMDVTVLTADQIALFKAKTKPVYTRWTGEIGADLVKAAEDAVAKAAGPARKPARKRIQKP